MEHRKLCCTSSLITAVNKVATHEEPEAPTLLDRGSVCHTGSALNPLGWRAMGCCLVYWGVSASTSCSVLQTHKVSVVSLSPPPTEAHLHLGSTWKQHQQVNGCWSKWLGFYRCLTPTTQLRTSPNSASLNSSHKHCGVVNIYTGLERDRRSLGRVNDSNIDTNSSISTDCSKEYYWWRSKSLHPYFKRQAESFNKSLAHKQKIQEWSWYLLQTSFIIRCTRFS